MAISSLCNGSEPYMTTLYPPLQLCIALNAGFVSLMHPDALTVTLTPTTTGTTGLVCSDHPSDGRARASVSCDLSFQICSSCRFHADSPDTDSRARPTPPHRDASQNLNVCVNRWTTHSAKPHYIMRKGRGLGDSVIITRTMTGSGPFHETRAGSIAIVKLIAEVLRGMTTTSVRRTGKSDSKVETGNLRPDVLSPTPASDSAIKPRSPSDTIHPTTLPILVTPYRVLPNRPPERRNEAETHLPTLPTSPCRLFRRSFDSAHLSATISSHRLVLVLSRPSPVGARQGSAPSS
ncbi:hypothetical protein D9619_013634 [Psilocybe cf. subviscida]|uniref:Uncharacterized protein n=1 Tax=Psilocybe cf. subviscida TaxID=2480587 RepID=A0A8H5F8W9_9AGAR|nr:hypothetical protein D9619_013634 [Psilocybe cf. subviscida]